jgi:hypothetical protein
MGKGNRQVQPRATMAAIKIIFHLPLLYLYQREVEQFKE